MTLANPRPSPDGSAQPIGEVGDTVGEDGTWRSRPVTGSVSWRSDGDDRTVHLWQRYGLSRTRHGSTLSTVLVEDPRRVAGRTIVHGRDHVRQPPAGVVRTGRRSCPHGKGRAAPDSGG